MLILFFGRTLLSFFNGDSEVIETGYIRLTYILGACFFTFMVEVFSGFLRGYGLSLLPAAVSLVGISGTRILWIFAVFRRNPTFSNIMAAYPVSMCVTAVILICCLFTVHPWKNSRTGQEVKL